MHEAQLNERLTMAQKKLTVVPKVDVDLDALLGAVYKETRAIRVGGKIYDIPTEIPARLVLQYTRLTRTIINLSAQEKALSLEYQGADEERRAAIDDELAHLCGPSDEEAMHVYAEILNYAFGEGAYERFLEELSIERVALLASVVINKQMDGQTPLAPTATT